MGDYQIFGLNVRSDIALPELLSAPEGLEPDVTVRVGNADAREPGRAGLHAKGEALIFVVPEIARYRIEQGRDVVVEPAPGAPERNVRLYLLGSVFGAILHQRGLLPLHANAVEIDGKAVAFMGASGEGKSTLAAWFHDRGHRVIADDVCVIGFDETSRAMVRPGLPRLRLWKEALEATGRVANDFPRSWEGDDDWDKFDVPLPRGVVASSPVELAAAYLLCRGDRLEITRLGGLEAIEAAMENTYRGQHIAIAGDPKVHWESCVRLVGTTPVFRLARPWGLDRLDKDVPQVMAHVESGFSAGNKALRIDSSI
ncbi:MAG: hypothetical protein ACJ8FL_00820 [Sphingomicrobium sp.]